LAVLSSASALLPCALIPNPDLVLIPIAKWRFSSSSLFPFKAPSENADNPSNLNKQGMLGSFDVGVAF
jgi:hypothetical protein